VAAEEDPVHLVVGDPLAAGVPASVAGGLDRRLVSVVVAIVTDSLIDHQSIDVAALDSRQAQAG
jgi:hypothetical protein